MLYELSTRSRVKPKRCEVQLWTPFSEHMQPGNHAKYKVSWCLSCTRLVKVLAVTHNASPASRPYQPHTCHSMAPPASADLTMPP